MVGGGHRVSVIQRVEDSHALHDDDDDYDDRNIKTMSSTVLGHPQYSSGTIAYNETEKENFELSASNGLRGKCVFQFFQI